MIYFCQKGNNNGGITDFILEGIYPEEDPKYEKNRASLANKATVSVNPRILQLDL